MPASGEDLAPLAAEYEARVREIVPAGRGGVPSFDLIWLGLGADGHTASLFPGTAALDETERLVVANEVPQLETRRMTMTFPLLHAAKRVQFLVTGAGKAEVIAEVVSAWRGEAKSAYPAARFSGFAGRLECVLDEAAAGSVRERD